MSLLCSVNSIPPLLHGLGRYNKMEKMPVISGNEEYKDLYDDVVIETRQAVEMCNIYRDILSGTMDAYASVISNNVKDRKSVV